MVPDMAGWHKTCIPGESFLGEYKAITGKYSSFIKVYVGGSAPTRLDWEAH
jgi:hypothetical protein